VKMDKAVIFLGIGFELVALCGAGVFLGQLIDQWMGWQNAGTLIMVLSFLVLWFFHLFFLIQKFENHDGPPS
jgi:4-amino-4-deoxy-L-arabinose transferase-like glycosyltransferase